MKTMLPLLAAAAMLAAPAAIARLPGRVAPAPADCPLTIAFASYGAGIDRSSVEAVDRLLRRDRAVRAVTRHHWGREGEVTYCVRTRSAADAGRLFRSIRALLPARPRGPVALSARSGLRYETPPPRH
ncbi:MAG TPA: hypothetical protein VMS43_00380 [Allosphingosinicella sp.]|nr:hypothetical protein [Allosphingosinicella sp.]